MECDRMREYLDPQPTRENPVVVENYPYGFYRTQMRYWIETKDRTGQRAMSQTLNPKNQQWNKPHPSTYSSILLAYRDTVNGHIEFNGLSFTYSGQEELDALLAEYPESKMSDWQRQQLIFFRAIIRTRKLVSCKITVNPTPEQQEEIKKHEVESTEVLKKAFVSYYIEEKNKVVKE